MAQELQDTRSTYKTSFAELTAQASRDREEAHATSSALKEAIFVLEARIQTDREERERQRECWKVGH